uniref:Uncharacterized protein n=1 Tax=Quercus lobata TaxID=97700 RepID=A0A7N2R647_QUELO
MSRVSTRSYKKVTSILDTIAKVKLCLVMLDLECDALVVEMFQSFLKIVRSNHPPTVLSAIETIMNLVIDESEDISLDLLSSLFAMVQDEFILIPHIDFVIPNEFDVVEFKVFLFPVLLKEIHDGLDFSVDDNIDEFGIFSVKYANDGRELVAASSNNSIYVCLGMCAVLFHPHKGADMEVKSLAGSQPLIIFVQMDYQPTI